MLVARRKKALYEAAEKIRTSYGAEPVVIPMDLSIPYAADALCRELQKRKITVDILVNNAGISTKGLFTNTNYERQHQEMNLNMVFLTVLSYRLIPAMLKKGEGLIINVASCSGFNPIPYNAVYSASKAYVLSLSQSLSYEYKDKGIQVLAVCPGATDTHFFDEIGHGGQKLRKPEDVVCSTKRAVRKRKAVCTDGSLSFLQSLLVHMLPRRAAVRLLGTVGKRTWGMLVNK